MADTIQVATPVLFLMPMTILTTTDADGCITSDAQAVMYNPNAHTKPPLYRSPGPLQTDVEITLPLSPQELVLFCYQPLNMLYTPATQQMVNEINRTAYFYSDEEFVSWKGNTRQEWFEERKMVDGAWENTAEAKHGHAAS